MKVFGIKIEWLAIISLLVYILLLQECRPGGNIFGGSKTDTLKHTIDTVLITHIDTITLPPVVQVCTLKIPTPVQVHDTVYVNDSIIVRSLNEYTTDITDSLIEGRVLSRVDGVLVSQSLIYSPKFPKYITRTDTVLVKESVVINKKKNFIYVGGEIGGNSNSMNLSPAIGIGTVKGYMYDYRYGLVDKTHNIRISKKLSLSIKK